LKLPPPPAYVCLYISAGKKDKVSKGDIAGFLAKKGRLTGDEIGLITPLDYSSYVSIKRQLVDKVMAGVKDQKLKNLKVKIEVASRFYRTISDLTLNPSPVVKHINFIK
jgi:hypothetical protein